jgi:uncharacterized membrane protein
VSGGEKRGSRLLYHNLEEKKGNCFNGYISNNPKETQTLIFILVFILFTFLSFHSQFFF